MSDLCSCDNDDEDDDAFLLHLLIMRFEVGWSVSPEHMKGLSLILKIHLRHTKEHDGFEKIIDFVWTEA